MIKKTLSITVFCLIFILPIYVYSSNILPFDFFSSSNDENCESQEICASKNRCKKLAKELYKKFFNSKILPVYQSYYNEELNKCFVIISSQNNTKKYLLEVNANEMIIHGIFIQANNDIDFCLVSNKGYKTKTNEDMPVKSNVKCKSRAEWDNLIKPYIEE
ncbi:MAG: hypothetical protein JW976_14415 [Syntrophaceae bacterium]|nr:hypothetical protein [Syntrophaceae bacterium]